MLSAANALLERAEALARLLGKIDRIEILGLQAKRGDGRPQFMCSIGDETSL